eukprot:430094_1
MDALLTIQYTHGMCSVNKPGLIMFGIIVSWKVCELAFGVYVSIDVFWRIKEVKNMLHEFDESKIQLLSVLFTVMIILVVVTIQILKPIYQPNFYYLVGSIAIILIGNTILSLTILPRLYGAIFVTENAGSDACINIRKIQRRTAKKKSEELSEELSELRNQMNKQDNEKMLRKREMCAAKCRNNIVNISSNPLHTLTAYDICIIIKSWILNDINHMKKSKIFLETIVNQSLSGEKLITLGKTPRKVVLEKIISSHMTQKTFSKTIAYLDKQIETNLEEIKIKTEQEIAGLIVDYSLDTLCSKITESMNTYKNINGAIINSNNDDFISWMERETGWDKMESKQINTILLRYKTKRSKDIKFEIYNQFQEEFDEKVAMFVKDDIEIMKLDLAKLQLKIKNGKPIDDEYEILLDIAEKVYQHKQAEHKEKQALTHMDDNGNFIQDFYRIFAHSLSTITREWMCFNCSNFNFPASQHDTNICNLCGITTLTSTIYALKKEETFAMVSHTNNLIMQNDEKVEHEEVKCTDNTLGIHVNCPDSIKQTACPAIIRLGKKLKFYQNWLNQIRLKNNNRDNIEFTTTTDISMIDNNVFKHIMIEALKLTKKWDDEKQLQLEQLLRTDLDIKVFYTLTRQEMINLMKSETRLKPIICMKTYNNARRLLRNKAFHQQFGEFLNEHESDKMIEDYHHILLVHMAKGNKTTKENVFRYYQHLIVCQHDKCSSMSRHAQRQMRQYISKNNNCNNDIDEEKKEIVIDMWSRAQYYAQSTLDVIHTYFVHHDYKSDICSDDDIKSQMSIRDSESQINLEIDPFKNKEQSNNIPPRKDQQTKPKYITNAIDNVSKFMTEYGFGMDYDYTHLTPKYKCLRDEIINNTIYVLRAHNFEECLMKAIKIKKIAIKDYKLICTYYDPDYNIIRNSLIGTKHILSMIIYTDCTEFCTAFRSTYRAMHPRETDQHITDRHRELYWYSRFLFTSIESFGTPMPKKMKVYHGLNKVMYFERFTSFFNNPVSTTTNIRTAQNFAEGNGVILQFKRANSKNPLLIPRFLDLTFLSVYPEEGERLFHGKNIVFQIVNIITHHENSEPTPHRQDLKALNLFQQVITNQQIGWIEMKTSLQNAMKHLIQLIEQRKNKIDEEKIYDDITTYGKELFDFFCSNISWIGIRNFHSIPRSLHKVLL